FDTASDAEVLVTRPRDVTDNAVPSGSSLAVELLAILGDVFDVPLYRERASRVLEGLVEPMARYPTAFGHALGATDMVVRGAVEVALPGTSGLAAAVADEYAPSLVLVGGAASSDLALMAGRAEGLGYVCRSYSCEKPTADAGELREQLRGARRSSSGG
ncbi:MAG: thioredoxin domain-containing protein, partial [Gemmatimonadaceae bacterium]